MRTLVRVELTSRGCSSVVERVCSSMAPKLIIQILTTRQPLCMNDYPFQPIAGGLGFNPQQLQCFCDFFGPMVAEIVSFLHFYIPHSAKSLPG